MIFLCETIYNKGLGTAIYLIPQLQIYAGIYALVLSEVGDSALIMLIVAVGSITGVICVDHTIRNTTKEAFRYLRLDTSLFLVACVAIYALRHQYSHVYMGVTLGVVCLAYLTWFFVGMTRTISQFLDIPFFSVKHKKA